MSQVAEPPAATPTKRPPRLRRGLFGRSSLTRDIVEVVLLALALYFIITFGLQTVRVDGTSMVPTLDSGDLLFADKVSYHLHGPSRGDIIILQPPQDTSTDFIKRVIGVPGDQLEIVPPDFDVYGPTDPGHTGPHFTSKHAEVVLVPSGQQQVTIVDESYLPTSGPWVTSVTCCGPNGLGTPEPSWITIPQDQFFVLGDNRNASKDSRAIGLIPRGNIVGRAWVRVWPLGRFGFLGSGPNLVAAGLLPIPLVVVRRRRRRPSAG